MTGYFLVWGLAFIIGMYFLCFWMQTAWRAMRALEDQARVKEMELEFLMLNESRGNSYSQYLEEKGSPYQDRGERIMTYLRWRAERIVLRKGTADSNAED